MNGKVARRASEMRGQRPGQEQEQNAGEDRHREHRQNDRSPLHDPPPPPTTWDPARIENPAPRAPSGRPIAVACPSKPVKHVGSRSHREAWRARIPGQAPPPRRAREDALPLPPPFTINSSTCPNGTVRVSLEGELDVASAPEL